MSPAECRSDSAVVTAENNYKTTELSSVLRIIRYATLPGFQESNSSEETAFVRAVSDGTIAAQVLLVPFDRHTGKPLASLVIGAGKGH